MKMIKKITVPVLITFCGLFVLAIAPRYDQQSILSLINGSFLIGLLLLVLSGTITVLGSGFLALFNEGFRKLGSLIFRKPRVLESDMYRTENQQQLRFFKQWKSWLTRTSLWVGLTFFLFSFLLTVRYYLL